MAESKNSFIQSKMNKDLDERLIPNNVYRDALNIAVSRSEGSDVGSLEAILGNRLLAQNDSMNLIGYYVDESKGLVYTFVTEHTGVGPALYNAACGIYVFNTDTFSYTPIISPFYEKYPAGWLNFSTLNPITGVSLIENLLYWTDNRNQPRKINVNNTIANNIHYYTNEEQVSVAKFSPYLAPEFIDNRSLSQIKPSTMSDASDPSTVSIGIYKLTSSNLALKKYKNGDQIPQASTLTAWNNYNNQGVGCWSYYDNNLGNGTTYGLLYNKAAVLDSRGLAPIGHTIPTLAQWNGILSSAGSSAAVEMKSENLWTTGAGNNLTGASIKPAGYRDGIVGADFQNINIETRIWTSDANSYVKYDTTNVVTTTGTATNTDGYSIRLLKNTNYNGWNGDPDYLTEKFVKFSYRFKFDDNEYSTVAPFSQDVFIPFQDGQFVNNDENQAFITTVVEFMENSVNNAVLNITLPCVDIITEYKIKSIDILFKQSDMQAYQVLETIRVDDGSSIATNPFILALNNTNIYQYSYESTLPIKTLPTSETTRVFDKVPVRALAQETSGNRIMYANYLEGYTAPKGLNYFASHNFKTTQPYVEYPQHSIKQNRNYQIGIILADKWGRQTDVVLSTQDGVLDANGNAQPGSNVFIPYFPSSFGSFVQAWLGSNLTIEFTQQIPEAVNSNSLSGYPGVYAVGSYYTVDPATATYPYCWSYSTQTIVTSTADQTVFDFFGLTYANAIDATTALNIYINSGAGWVLQPPADYTLTSEASKPRITFATGIIIGYSVKAEILFTISSRSKSLYKYEIGAASGTVNPLFPGWKDDYGLYFIANKYFRGEYIDYTVTPSNLTVLPILDGNGDVRAVTFYTEQEISSNYLFDDTPTTRPEPSLNGNKKTWATYTINPNGFYSYKVVVKQQQQDYYNVYLPGIVNGYPIDGSTLERGEIAFCTLISDNINKVPRNLQDVGPIQNQFTSDVDLFGRVTNIVGVSNTTGTYETYNRQYVPGSNADSVDLVGTLKDVFPDLTSTTGAGKVNEYAIYDYDTKPYVAKISTRNSIGLTEGQYTAPVDGNGNYPYPENMGLAVYETAPFESQLEIYYETSTAGLISDLNEASSNEETNISGISAFTTEFQEKAFVGTVITTDFFPTAGGTNVLTATVTNMTVFANGPSGNLDTTSPQTSRFSLQAGDSQGSFRIVTNDVFYAGSSAEPNFDVTTRGKFTFTLTFLQADGISVNQTLTIQLENDKPIIDMTGSGNPTVVTGGALVLYSTTFGAANQSPGGLNGSAANPDDNTGVPSNGTWYTFGASPNGWSVLSATRTLSDGTVQNYVSAASTTANSLDVLFDTTSLGAMIFQATTGDSGAKPKLRRRFALSVKNTVGNVSGALYNITLRLTDSLGATQDLDVSYSVGSTIYGGVVATNYEGGLCISSVSAPNVSTSTNLQRSYPNGNNPVWNGQIQNWTSDTIYVYIRTSINNGPYASSPGRTTMVGGTFADNTTGGTDGDGTSYIVNATTDAIIGSFNNGSAGSSSNFELIAKLQPFTQVAGGSARTMAQLLSAGVRPGQKKTTGQVYDFSGCALVNCKYSMPISNVGMSGTIFVSTSGTAPPAGASSIINVQQNTNPPFLGASSGTPAKITCPTTFPLPEGP